MKPRKGKKIIIGNWKLNPSSLKEAKLILGAIARRARRLGKTKVALCVPFVFLSPLLQQSRKTKVSVGAQNVFYEEKGSFTGEISVPMLRSIGVSYVIVGHSERRALGESNTDINRKIVSALDASLTPVLCIGEKIRDDEGKHLEFIKDELKQCLARVSYENLKKMIIAYEPIWAIGKSDAEAMQPADLHEMTIFIRKTLTDFYRGESMSSLRILYGGSVNSKIAGPLMREGAIDGLLVGKVSLDPVEFNKVLEIANGI